MWFSSNAVVNIIMRCGHVSVSGTVFAQWPITSTVPSILFVFYLAPNSGQNVLCVFG